MGDWFYTLALIIWSIAGVTTWLNWKDDNPRYWKLSWVFAYVSLMIVLLGGVIYE